MSTINIFQTQCVIVGQISIPSPWPQVNTLLRIHILIAVLVSSLKPMGNFLFIWIEDKHFCSLCCVKRQDLSSLSTSFFTDLYVIFLPWRFPFSEFPHGHYFSFYVFNILSFLRIFSIYLWHNPTPTPTLSYSLVLPPEMQTVFSSCSDIFAWS